jgi:hypothetical protein
LTLILYYSMLKAIDKQKELRLNVQAIGLE